MSVAFIIGDMSSDKEESSSSHPNTVEDYAMLVNNSKRLSYDLNFDEIPGFNVREPPAPPKNLEWDQPVKHGRLRRAYTARWSEIKWDMKEVKEPLERSIVMSYGNKKHNTSQDPKMVGGPELGDNVLSTMALML